MKADLGKDELLRIRLVDTNQRKTAVNRRTGNLFAFFKIGSRVLSKIGIIFFNRDKKMCSVLTHGDPSLRSGLPVIFLGLRAENAICPANRLLRPPTTRKPNVIPNEAKRNEESPNRFTDFGL